MGQEYVYAGSLINYYAYLHPQFTNIYYQLITAKIAVTVFCSHTEIDHPSSFWLQSRLSLGIQINLT